jgi:hypothetical protein
MTEAAALMLDIARNCRIVAAHFADPEKALEFARLCEGQAAMQGATESPLVNSDNRHPFEAWR